MNTFELYKEIKLPHLVDEVNSIFNIIDNLSKKNNTSKSLYSVNTINFLNESESNVEYKPLLDITNKYKFLQKFLRVLTIKPSINLALHIDGLKNTNLTNYNLNIPISGCSDSCITEFFEVDEKYIITDIKRNTRFVKQNAPIKKIDEYKLLENSFLCYTQIPHRVINNSNIDRVCVSWAVKKEYTIEKILNYNV
jgi:hypothetical protein